jgi:hypothetical protein
VAGYPTDKYCACCGSPLHHICKSCGSHVLQPVAYYCTQCGIALESGTDGGGNL